MQDFVLLLRGLIDLPWWGYILVTLAMAHVSIASVTIFLHRHQTHRAVDLHPALSHFFRFWLFLTTGMVTKEWVAVHRKHHANAETDDDPHSPQRLGIRRLILSGAEVYEAGYRHHPEILDIYGTGTPDDWLERNLYGRRYGTYVGILLLELIYVALFGSIGITMWAVHMMWIPFFAAGLINGLGHWWGYRNHACPDASTNLFPWGILIGGEELHNNHHAFASSAKFSSKRWEFDIGWLYIRILCRLGLAQTKKVAPQLVRDRRRAAINAGTVEALTVHRLQILANYDRRVLLPVFRAGFPAPDPSSQALEALLVRPQVIMDSDSEQRIAEALQRDPALASTYRFRTRMDQIGTVSNTPPGQQLDALREWCCQAKVSGIEALIKFSDTLPGYTTKAAGSGSR